MNKTGRKQPAWRTLFPPLLVANSPFSPSSDLRVFALGVPSAKTAFPQIFSCLHLSLQVSSPGSFPNPLPYPFLRGL